MRGFGHISLSKSKSLNVDKNKAVNGLKKKRFPNTDTTNNGSQPGGHQLILFEAVNIYVDNTRVYIILNNIYDLEVIH